MKRSEQHYRRADAEPIEGSDTKFKATYKVCGHSRTMDINQGKPKHLHVTGAGARFLIRYWRDGVNIGPCPTCKRLKTLQEKREKE